VNSRHGWSDGKAARWRELAERVLGCRHCTYIRNKGGSLFHPEPGWGNLYAPVFVIGINGNWGVRGRKELDNLQELRASIDKGKDRQCEPLVHYWDDRRSCPDPARCFDLHLPCPNSLELNSRLKMYYGLPGDNSHYDRTLFKVLGKVLRSSCEEISWSIDSRILMWRWVYWANAVRCPSGNSSELPEEEFESCFLANSAVRPSGAILSEELLLVGPSLVIVFGAPTMRRHVKGSQTLENHVGTLLRMTPADREEVRIDHRWSFSTCTYRESWTDHGIRSQVHALFLPHPSARGVPRELWRYACQAAYSGWKACNGAPPTKLYCVNVFPGLGIGA
jgi:hypothetical protein